MKPASAKHPSKAEAAAQFSQWKKQIAEGDPGSEDDLCRYLNGRFTPLFLSQAYSLSAIEDASQEAIISLLKALRQGRIEDDSCIDAYFYSSIKYQLWNSVKKARRLSPLQNNLQKINADYSVDCLDRVEKQQKLQHVLRSVESLKVKRDRDILLKTFFKEEGIDSVCEQLKLQRNHYYRVLHRARNRLSQLM